MIQPSEAELAQYHALSRKIHEAQVKELRALFAANKRLIEGTADTAYTISAQAVFATAIIYGTVAIQNASYQGYNITFNGQVWGLGFGGGTSYGALTLTVPPAQLNNLECDCTCAFAGGSTTISFSNKQYGKFGIYAGTGVGVGLSAAHGSGEWHAT
jgi:hypothetical protein